MNQSYTSEKGRGIWAWDIVKVVLILSTLAFASIFYFKGFNEESNRIIIRLTARISGILFCLAFGASAFHRWQRHSFSWWLMMNRKFWGISFALIHLIHLAFLGLLQFYFHPVFEQATTISLMAGGLAYLFAVLMLLTSFDFFAKFLSKKNWKRLHTVGGYWIWFIFMNSYAKRVDTALEYLPLVVLFVGVLLLRIWKRS